jgi:hypothetical protein
MLIKNIITGILIYGFHVTNIIEITAINPAVIHNKYKVALREPGLTGFVDDVVEFICGPDIFSYLSIFTKKNNYL